MGPDSVPLCFLKMAESIPYASFALEFLSECSMSVTWDCETSLIEKTGCDSSASTACGTSVCWLAVRALTESTKYLLKAVATCSGSCVKQPFTV